MLYQDAIYDPTTIGERVLGDLLASAAATCLRGIYQAGIGDLLQIARGFSRYSWPVRIIK